MSPHRIPWLVSDLPDAAALGPFLARIDAARVYSNNGPLVQELEGVLAAMVQAYHPQAPAPFVVLASSGTTALHMAAAASGAPAGATATVPSFTFPATAHALQHAGFQVELADVEAKTGTLSPTAVSTAAAGPVVPVAVFGSVLDTALWDNVAKATGRPVIIDAAASFPHQAPGQCCHVVVSFHATKPFGIGEGGALITTDPAMADRARKLANFGFEDGVVHAVGLNAKMSELHAAVGLAQAQRWPDLAQARADLWTAYRDALPQNRIMPCLAGQAVAPANLVLDCGDHAVDAVQQHLSAHGIGSRRLYTPGLHHHPWRRRQDQPCPVTEHLADCLISLPFHTRLTRADVCSIATAVRGLFGA
ncbi:MAG: DegT/DnrJ/EryC1/StrS family aminotransferase [Alphaproteobacteria bacterium]|nr:DegT/DnrJ/EryC1/StrS family aminotransferase [Alphaproteobacteria bacterium]